MKKVAALVLASTLAFGCGDDNTGSGGNGGTGGSSGAGGAGGASPPPASVDQTCRDWCANEPEGPSCHQGPFESIRVCYEGCLQTYQLEEAERECGAEWIAIKDCQLALSCEDAFGDCGPNEEQLDECQQIAANRAYCATNCPDLAIEACEQDITECEEIVFCEATCPSLSIEVCRQDTAACQRIANNRAYCQANCPSLDIALCQQDTTECWELASNRAYCRANCPSLSITACEQDPTECEQLVAARNYCELSCPLLPRQECIDQYVSTGSCDSSGSDGFYTFTCLLSGLPIPMPVTIKINADDPGFTKGQASSLTTLLNYDVAPAVVGLLPDLAPTSMFEEVEVTVTVTGGTPTQITHGAVGLPFSPIPEFDSNEVTTVVTAGASASQLSLSVSAARFLITGMPASLVPEGFINLEAGQGECDALEPVAGSSLVTFPVQ